MRHPPSATMPWAPPEAPNEVLEVRKLAMARLLERYDYMRHEPWRAFANCTSANAELFFPDERDQQDKVAKVQEAREICAPCAVKLECLAFAITGGDRGIWAGTTEEQRVYAATLPEGRRMDWLLNAVRTATGQYAEHKLIEWKETA